MDWVIMFLRIGGVASMAAATGITLVELHRLRQRSAWSLRGLHVTLIVSFLGLLFRIVTSLNAFLIDIPTDILLVMANGFFLILGVLLSASALGVYRAEMEREAMQAVSEEITRRLE